MKPLLSTIFRRSILLLTLSTAAIPSLAQPSAQTSEPYLNPSLPISQRVDDLVSRMTLEEKVAQLQNEAPAIPRLHVQQYDWWNEALHGVARSGHATVFPQAIGLAATFDPALVHRIADTISTEARAKYHQAQREQNYSIFYGLTMWSPNINIFRDPRWGRGQETYGEDPFLTSQIGTAFVEGLQGDDPNYLKTVATPKHYAVHSGPESSRHTFDVRISPYDLEDTYLPAFRATIVDAHAASIMCAYNSVNGDPACASKFLLDQTLRRDWRFTGYVVSDCNAITDVSVGHKFAPDMAHGAAVSLNAGTDLSCGREYATLLDAIHKNLITEADLDTALRRLFTARFRLGMFDPPARVPFSNIPFSEDDSPAHGALALQAALASMVLLKNDHNALPLSPTIKTLAIIGPNADALPALEGNYNAIASNPITPLVALQQRLPGRINYAQGSPYVEGFPTPVPTTVFTPAPNSTEHGLKAEYFNNDNFSGQPILTRTDRLINFDWNGAAPAEGIFAHTFGVRWTGFITPPAAGSIGFSFLMAHCSTCEDVETVNLWLDDKLVYQFKHERTHGRRAPTPAFTLNFADTNPHALRIEYTHDAPHFGAGLTFNWNPPLEALRNQAVTAATDSDAILAFVGLSPELEGEETPIHIKGFEGGDRTAIELPDAQLQLIDALATTGKPLILVLMNGSALALQSAADKSAAILEAWYPGQSGGTAITQTLFGESNPGGRLPITFYASTADLPAFEDYAMKNRTYRYFTGTPLYPFGYGLSYTTFKYANARLSTNKLQAGKPLTATIQLTNTGTRAGDEIIELYLIPHNQPQAPLRKLVVFTRHHLAPNETATITTTINPRELSLVNPDGTRAIHPGQYDLYIGPSQPTPASGVTIPFQIEGTAPIAP